MSTALPDYAPLPQRPNLPRLFLNYFLRTIIWGVVIILLIAAFVLVVPRFKEVFRDFRTSLPTLTMLLLNASDLIAHHYGWIPMLTIPFIVPIPMLLVEGVCQPNTARRLRRFYNLFLIVGFCLLVFTMSWGLMMPLIKLIESVK